MTQVEIARNDDFPHITNQQFLEILATDVDVLDTTPADALMGTVRYMPTLATEVVVVFLLGLASFPMGEPLFILPELLFNG